MSDVRAFRRDDLTAAAQLAQRARAADASIEPFGEALAGLWGSDRARKELWRVAEGGGILIGAAIAVERSKDQLEIYGAVHPSHRRRGVAARMLKPALDAATRDRLGLRASVRDSRAGRAFLEAHGFGLMSKSLLLVRDGSPPQVSQAVIRALDVGRSEDRALLLALGEAAFAGAPDGVRTRSTDLTRLGAAGALALTAELDGKPAAYLAGRLLGDNLAIEELGTLPSARRRGLGRGLLAAALRRTGALAAMLWVDAADEGALAFYRGLGFGETGARSIYERPAKAK